jgi:hypothetical protein
MCRAVSEEIGKNTFSNDVEICGKLIVTSVLCSVTDESCCLCATAYKMFYFIQFST